MLFESINLAVITLQHVMGIVGWVAVFVLWRQGQFRTPDRHGARFHRDG